MWAEWAWRQYLAQNKCPGRPTSAGFRDQLERLKNHLFPGKNGEPGKRDCAISALRQPEPKDLEWLARFTKASKPVTTESGKAANAVESQQPVSAAPATLLPAKILREFGILSAAQLGDWAKAAKAAEQSDASSDSEASD